MHESMIEHRHRATIDEGTSFPPGMDAYTNQFLPGPYAPPQLGSSMERQAFVRRIVINFILTSVIE